MLQGISDTSDTRTPASVVEATLKKELPPMLFDDAIQPKIMDSFHLVMRQHALDSICKDSCGITYADGTPFEADILGKNFSFKDKIVIRGQSGAVGVIMKVFSALRLTYILYGFHPAVAGQEPSTVKYQDHALYYFAQIVANEPYCCQYTLDCANGTYYQVRVDGGHFFINRRMYIEQDNRVCAFAQEQKVSNSEGTTKVWSIEIAHSVDPLLMLAAVASLEECEEGRYRRKKCLLRM